MNIFLSFLEINYSHNYFLKVTLIKITLRRFHSVLKIYLKFVANATAKVNEQRRMRKISRASVCVTSTIVERLKKLFNAIKENNTCLI